MAEQRDGDLVFEGVEGVRRRPGMFVGDVEGRASTHQLVWEVLANAIDQHLAGRCTRIDVVLHADGSISVSDDGPGVSVDPHESGVSWLERVLTTLHVSPTADGHAPHTHLGLFSVGLCVVSALSSSLSVEVRRDGGCWRIELKRGAVTKTLARVGPAEGTGTTIRFTPDATVMAMPDFEIETVAKRVRELASLLPGLVTSLRCELREHGPALTIAALLEPRGHGRRRHSRGILGEAREAETVARVAFEWRDWPVEPNIVGYCNLEVTPRGAHLEGFHQGLAKGLGRRDHRRVLDALSGGLNAVVSVLVVDPTFQGPPWRGSCPARPERSSGMRPLAPCPSSWHRIRSSRASSPNA